LDLRRTATVPIATGSQASTRGCTLEGVELAREPLRPRRRRRCDGAFGHTASHSVRGTVTEN
jgi:hypothetical protein